MPCVRVTVMMPFGDDAGLWRMRPEQWKSTAPLAGIDRCTIVISRAFSGVPGGNAALTWYRNEMATIRWYLEVMEKQITKYHGNIEQLLPRMIESTVQKLAVLRKFTDNLNLDVG